MGSRCGSSARIGPWRGIAPGVSALPLEPGPGPGAGHVPLAPKASVHVARRLRSRSWTRAIGVKPQAGQLATRGGFRNAQCGHSSGNGAFPRLCLSPFASIIELLVMDVGSQSRAADAYRCGQGSSKLPCPQRFADRSHRSEQTASRFSSAEPARCSAHSQSTPVVRQLRGRAGGRGDRQSSSTSSRSSGRPPGEGYTRKTQSTPCTGFFSLTRGNKRPKRQPTQYENSPPTRTKLSTFAAAPG